MYKFSKRSLDNLNTCHPDLRRVAHRAMSFQIMDFSITCGARTLEEQQKAFYAGYSTVDGINKVSKHQVGKEAGRDLSDAFDIVHYPVDWNNTMAFHILAGIMLVAAKLEGVKLRWGGDWDGDFTNKDQSFHDLPHYERVT